MATKVLLLCLICYIARAQPAQLNITRGSTLYTNTTSSFWPSSSGHFAFGFYPNSNGFRVGIWIIGRPKNTIVWTARREDPVVSSGATVLFSSDGKLLLLSSGGAEQLIAETNQVAFVASMLDSGNFVLYDSNMDIVWDSFHHPTHTILVNQELVASNSLYSSKSESDDSIGKFRLYMGTDGNLFALPSTSLAEGMNGYWFTYTPDTGNNVSLTLGDGRLYLKNSTGFTIKNLTGGELPVDQTTLLYRATFDIDGIFRLYQHQMGSLSSLTTEILWEAISGANGCSVKGVCGLNSYCTLNGLDIACLCPPGFDFVDPNRNNSGCQVIFSFESECSAYASSDSYDITSLENTSWEQDEYCVLTAVSEDACSKACLADCQCKAAMFRDQMCFMLKLPLRYGNKNTSIPTKSFFKINIEHDICPMPVTRIIKPSKRLLIAGVVLIAFSLIVFLLTGYVIYKHKILGYKILSTQNFPQADIIEEINLRAFCYDQLVAATNNFNEEIGRGASGKVYKGLLANNIGGKEIAVKMLEKMVQDGEGEFHNEMKIIGRTHHRNLVRLLGFCSEGSNRLLVYEFMKNGSLGNLLFKAKEKPSWRVRTKIAREIAKGLHYLHEECETKIIHCDIKPHNVLMDESWSARISDFGLSKLLKPDQTRTYTRPRGTPGYEAPEWHKTNSPITTKADVYSFGVMLLEIICLRKNIDLSVPDEEVILTDWAYKCYEARMVKKLFGETEVGTGELEKMVKIGLLCVQPEPNTRPTMKQVVLMLDDTIVTPPPTSISSNNN